MAQPQNVLYPAAPAAPTQNITDFDVSTAALARRRRLAQLLQEQAITKGLELPNPQALASWTNVLAPLSQALVGKIEEGRINEEEKKAMTDREAAAAPLAEDFFSKLRGQTIPGQEATPMIPSMEMGPPSPSGAMSQQPEQPAQPAVPEKMIPPDLIGALQAGNAYARVGGPAAQKMVDAMIPHLTKEILPSEHVTESGIYRKPGGGASGAWVQGDEGTSPGFKTKTAETAAAHRAAETQAQESLMARIQAGQDRNATAQQIADGRNATALLVAQIRAESVADRAAAAGGGGKMYPTDQYSLNGNPVQRNTQGELFESVGGKPVPYAGPLTDKTTVVKGAADAAKSTETLGKMQSILDDVKDNPKNYAVSAGVASKLPAVGDINLKLTGTTGTQLEARAKAASFTADITHSLYGSAFTAGESERAKAFIIGPMDGPETISAKMRGRMELEKAHLANISPAATAAFNARKGGGTGDLRSKYGLTP